MSSTDGFDVAINEHEFKIASTDENPYQRATAQFRKDQFDSGNSTGDQSLTGWWTRGEFSFHKGAGVDYYEVSEGETILNRYDTGDAVVPWKPGKVTSQLGWSSYGSLLGGGARVAWAGFSGDKFIIMYATGFTQVGTLSISPTDLNPVGGGLPTSIDTTPTTVYYVTNAGDVEKFANTGTPTPVAMYDGLVNPNGLWYVKSRLLISDGDGSWYQLSPNIVGTATVAVGDRIFQAFDWDDQSVVCDTPGPILIANSNRIFSLTPDSTGTLPVLSAPIQVGELPPGEIVRGMTSHLGFVVLVTTAGVRVGVLSDAGQLTYGPLLVERTGINLAVNGLGFTSTIAKDNTRVLCTLGSQGIIEIDLAQQIGSTLEFAWTGRGTPAYGVNTTLNSGVLRAITGINVTRIVVWANDAIFTSNDAFTTGTLTTGLHRFNTLEKKRFDTVRVTADGTFGTIAISKVAADGTVTLLHTMDVATEKDVEVSFGSTAGEQAIGLRFVLTPAVGHSDTSPVLLGYQIKALPEPQRQHMIRVPVLLFDTERRQPARAKGRDGYAWERLDALEQLESQDAVVTYQDYRTGENTQAYIESIEFTAKTPPTANAKSFGGIAFITLRKLS